MVPSGMPLEFPCEDFLSSSLLLLMSQHALSWLDKPSLLAIADVSRIRLATASQPLPAFIAVLRMRIVSLLDEGAVIVFVITARPPAAIGE
jgi:hypothetical protein